MGLLQGLTVFKENALLGSPARGHHDGGRRGQSQSAGAGDHQHGHHSNHGSGQTQVHDHPPNQEGDQGDKKHDGHKDTGHLIGEALNGRPTSLSLFHQTDNLCQGRLGTHLPGLELKSSLLVDGTADDLISRLLGDGETLPRHHTLVHGRSSFGDQAVHGNLFSRPDHHNVPYGYFRNRNVDFLMVSQHTGRLGAQTHEFLDGRTGLAFSPNFQQFSQFDQGDDHGSRFIVNMGSQSGTAQDQGNGDRYAVKVGG